MDDEIVDKSGKSNRTLSMYARLSSGKIIYKSVEARRFGVNEKSIQRDLDEIRNYLDNQTAEDGIPNELIYDRKVKGYRFVQGDHLSMTNAEILAVSKILLDSRAFTKKEMESLISKLVDNCVPKQNQELVNDLLRNERFHYIQPKHGKIYINNMWDIGKAIHAHKIIEFDYQGLQGHSPKHRIVEPQAIMFSDYYFYLVAFIRNIDKKKVFSNPDDSFPTIYRIDRIQNLLITNDNYKDMFLIFDYCGNFEYFGTHPDGKEGKQATTLTQRRFNVLLDMLFALQRLEYQEQDWYRDYYNEIKKELHGELVKIKNNSFRIQVRESMQYVDKYYDLDTWKALSPVNVKEAKIHIGPLLDGGVAGDYLSVAFDIRVYNIERSLFTIESINNAIDDVKNIRLIAQYMMLNKASIPQVLAKAKDLKRLVDNSLWEHPTVPELEELRVSVRELMQFLKGEKNPTYDVNIKDEIVNSDYIPGDTVIDIRTYREKVIDYLVNNSDSAVIKKIYNLEPITSEDIQELEHVLWTELGTHEDYDKTTDISNLAAFVRSLIGLSQEAVNEKFGEYLSGNVFNSQQQEFIWTIINYVRENGDIEVSDIANVEPFNNFDIVEMFGEMIPKMVDIVNTLHNSIEVA